MEVIGGAKLQARAPSAFSRTGPWGRDIALRLSSKPYQVAARESPDSQPAEPGKKLQPFRRVGVGTWLRVWRPALVRLRVSVHWRVKVPLWRSFPPVTESNCIHGDMGWRATGSEGIVRRTVGQDPRNELDTADMRLTRLRAVNEVRRTAASPQGDAEAKSARSKKHCRNGGAWSGWRRNVPKCVRMNQGDLLWCWKEQSRSQSPHSSDEASNDRGAKGGRKVET
jgi:hypothetical protein